MKQGIDINAPFQRDIEDLDIYPPHPYFKNSQGKAEIMKDMNQDDSYIDDFFQLVNFWHYNMNIGSSNSTILGDCLDKNNEATMFKEYILSLLHVEGDSYKNLFPQEILMDTLVPNKKSKDMLNKVRVINKIELIENKKARNNEDDNLLFGGNEGQNEDTNISQEEDEDLFDGDLEYANINDNDEFDELADNANDYDVI
ncbi:hypothetical protein ACR3K2_16110 [Cryptosporidium serpentis]